MQVSASDHCAKSILFTVFYCITSKGQINEERLLCNVESQESLSLAGILTPCFGKIVWLLLLSDGFQESLHYQESCCLFQFRARMSRALNSFFCAGRIQAPVLVQCLASLANWCGVRAAIQFISITITEGKAGMQVSASDHCAKTILFTVSILAKVQINEDCPLRNVESWKSWTLADAANLVSRGFLVANAAVLWLPWILSLPGIMLPVPVQSRNEQSIEQLLLCRKNISTFASSMSCQSCQLMWRSCCNPVDIDHQYWRKGRHAGVSQWPLCENHSLHSLHPRQSSDQWRVSPSQCWKLKKLDFGRCRKPCVKRILGCWCCCVMASRNPVATRNHVARSSPGQEWAEHWTNLAMLEEYKHLP